MRRQAGFSYIEILVSIVMLALVAGGLAAGMVAANRQVGGARVENSATTVAQETLDNISKLDYDKIGNTGASPPVPGDLPPEVSPMPRRGKVDYKVAIDVRYKDDKAGGQPRLYANYKEVTITVTPQVVGATPTVVSKFFSPASAGAVRDKGTAVITVLDSLTSDPIDNASVLVNGSTSAPRSDFTDALGVVAFGLLEPSHANPLNPLYEYRFTPSKSGYAVHPTTNNVKAHLGAGQTATPVIKMFKPATIRVNLLDRATNLPINEFSTVSVKTPDPGSLTETVSQTNGVYVFTQIVGKPIEPRSAPFLITASVDCYGTTTRSSPIPIGYPGTTDQTFNIPFDAQAHGNLNLQVVNNTTGVPISGATVQVSGGTQNIAPRTRTTSAGGTVSYCLEPSGTIRYVVSATATGFGAGAALTAVTTGNTTTLQIRLVPITNSCTIVLNAGASGRLVRLQAVVGTYEAVQLTDGTGRQTFAGLAAGNYRGYVATGTAGDGSPVFSPPAGKLVACVANQSREYPVP
jgi:type II secretory pathway pseudopilin PulG